MWILSNFCLWSIIHPILERELLISSQAKWTQQFYTKNIESSGQLILIVLLHANVRIIIRATRVIGVAWCRFCPGPTAMAQLFTLIMGGVVRVYSRSLHEFCGFGEGLRPCHLEGPVGVGWGGGLHCYKPSGPCKTKVIAVFAFSTQSQKRFRCVLDSAKVDLCQPLSAPPSPWSWFSARKRLPPLGCRWVAAPCTTRRIACVDPELAGVIIYLIWPGEPPDATTPT